MYTEEKNRKADKPECMFYKHDECLALYDRECKGCQFFKTRDEYERQVKNLRSKGRKIASIF